VRHGQDKDTHLNRITWKYIVGGRTFLHWLPYLIIVWCLGWMAYGFLTYPYAPIKPCGTYTFCDKRHVEQTRQEYERFRYWEMLLFMSWPAGMVSGFVIRKRHRQLLNVKENVKEEK
jgi:hypothetical protein